MYRNYKKWPEHVLSFSFLVLIEALNADSKLNLNNIKADFIIVGQGLAGTVLALKLMQKNFKVKVIDKPQLSSCSKVAAGIWNPIVFKRLTKSWMADEVLPTMLEFYKSQEQVLGTKLVAEKKIVKLFTEQQEADLWKNKSTDGNLFLDQQLYNDSPNSGINYSEGGYSKVLNTGHLYVAHFLETARDFFIKTESYYENEFDFKHLKINEAVEYNTIMASKIIFAEGYLIKNNPLFNYIPFKPAKGEVLTVYSETLDLKNEIINKNAFVLPLGSNTFKVGATYDWDLLNDTTTDTGKTELEVKLKKLISAKYSIIKQEAGVRPSVIDRRPVIGASPMYKNAYVFNGLGTKGVMLAPYFADELINHIINKTNINKEADVARFSKFFVN